LCRLSSRWLRGTQALHLLWSAIADGLDERKAEAFVQAMPGEGAQLSGTPHPWPDVVTVPQFFGADPEVVVLQPVQGVRTVRSRV